MTRSLREGPAVDLVPGVGLLIVKHWRGCPEEEVSASFLETPQGSSRALPPRPPPHPPWLLSAASPAQNSKNGWLLHSEVLPAGEGIFVKTVYGNVCT